MSGQTRGETAKNVGVHIETLRYYERRGLIPKPSRSASNYRLYSQDTVRRVRFVKHAQELGFSLKEIKNLLSLRATTGAKCADVRKRTEAKIQDIEAKIRSLQAMRRALSKLVAECSGDSPIRKCPILDALDSPKIR